MPFDPYRVLEVDKEVSAEEIRRVYRLLARKYHPDLNKGLAAEARFKELGQAYAILSDEKKRALFDEFGEASLNSYFDPEQARRGTSGSADARPPQYRQEAREAESENSSDVFFPLEIELGLALSGGEVRVSSPVGGAQLTLTLPPAVEPGFQICFKGRGRPGHRGGRPGDLYFEIQVLPHPYFRREGGQLVLDLPLTIPEAFFGATLDIPTPRGWTKISVPPGSRGGELLCLAERGCLDATGRRGDLFVHLCIRLPERLDAAGRLLDRLASLYREPVRGDLRL